MLGYCQSAALATVAVAETAQIEAHTAHYFLFVTAATDQPSTASCSQIIQIIHCPVEITSDKDHA